MSSQSAIVSVTRTITVAGGVYAPGHLGELTQVVPFELVDAVLEETGGAQQRLRDLPSRVGVYLLLAMGLFEHVGLAMVWSKLVAGLSEPRTQPGLARRIKHRLGFAGYPMLMLMALVETGTQGPGWAGFAVAVQAARDSVVAAAGVVAQTVDLVGQTGQAILTRLLPARRPHFSTRKVKSPISRYHAHTDTQRPLTSTTITAVDVTICQPTAPTPPHLPAKRTHRHRPAKPANRTHLPAAPSTAHLPGRRSAVLTILRSTPGQTQRARGIARTLGITGETSLNSFCAQMPQWAHQGLLNHRRHGLKPHRTVRPGHPRRVAAGATRAAAQAG